MGELLHFGHWPNFEELIITYTMCVPGSSLKTWPSVQDGLKPPHFFFFSLKLTKKNQFWLGKASQ